MELVLFRAATPESAALTDEQEWIDISEWTASDCGSRVIGSLGVAGFAVLFNKGANKDAHAAPSF